MYPLIPGDWYLCYICQKCKARQVLFPDLSRGTSRINAEFITQCSDCGHDDAYDSAEINRYQHPVIEATAS
jgi:hypothetical protein